MNRDTEEKGRFFAFIERLGWVGVPLAVGALFFLLGALISLLDGDTRPAMQSLIVTIILLAGAFWSYLRR